MKKHRNGTMGLVIMLILVLSTAHYNPLEKNNMTGQSVHLTLALSNMLIDRNNMNIYIDMMNKNYGGLMFVISCC